LSNKITFLREADIPRFFMDSCRISVSPDHIQRKDKKVFEMLTVSLLTPFLNYVSIHVISY